MPDIAATAPFVTAEAFNRAITGYPWFGQWLGIEATAIGLGGAKVRLPVRPEFLRHGGTVSGPIVMAVADVAMYAAIMGAVADGERAVTSDMTLHFVRRPSGDDGDGVGVQRRRGVARLVHGCLPVVDRAADAAATAGARASVSRRWRA